MNLTAARVLPLLAVVLASQIVIGNPRKVSNSNAGRIIELDEVMRIEESQRFNFISPHNIKINEKGEIFVQDRQQLLQFDSNGRFIRNYLSIGQGPGEIESIYNYQLTTDGLVVHGSPPKILFYDDNGKVKREVPIRARIWLTNFQLYRGNRYFFLETDWSKLAGQENIVVIPLDLYALDNDGETFINCATFPVRYFFAQSGGERTIIQVDRLHSVSWGNSLAISSTSEYMISIFDADACRVVRTIRRDYRRIKDTTSSEGPKITMGGKTYRQPKKEFRDDILGLMVSDNNLWVINSATDKRVGIHIDVINEGGEFIDGFILRFKKEYPPKIHDKYQLAMSGRYIYAVMMGPNDLFYIGKYRISE